MPPYDRELRTSVPPVSIRQTQQIQQTPQSVRNSVFTHVNDGQVRGVCNNADIADLTRETLPASVIFPILANQVLPQSQAELLADSFSHQTGEWLPASRFQFLKFTIGRVTVVAVVRVQSCFAVVDAACYFAYTARHEPRLACCGSTTMNDLPAGEHDYQPPVNQLLGLGRPKGYAFALNYASLGITPEHIPELIHMMTDDELHSASGESTRVWAPVHAWRALAELKAEQAIEPLLGLLQRVDDRNDDWVWHAWPPFALPALRMLAAPLGQVLFVGGKIRDFPILAAHLATTDTAPFHTGGCHAEFVALPANDAALGHNLRRGIFPGKEGLGEGIHLGNRQSGALLDHGCLHDRMGSQFLFVVHVVVLDEDELVCALLDELLGGGAELLLELREVEDELPRFAKLLD